jgi:acyl-CoA:6-aminopenicillanic acid acyl transferase
VFVGPPSIIPEVEMVRAKRSTVANVALILATLIGCSAPPPDAEVAGRASGTVAADDPSGRPTLAGGDTAAASGVLYLSGTPEQLGEQQAEALGTRAATLVDEWLYPKLNTYGFVGHIYASSKAANMEGYILDEHLAEMSAFANRAGLDYRSVLVANSAADIMQLASLGNVFGCTTFVVTPSRSATGRMLVGRNLDYPDSELLRSQWVPVVIAPEGKLKFLSIHAPGLAGVLTGINEKGVFLAIKVSHTGTSTSSGTPAGLIFREVLEAATTGAQAVEMYTRAMRTVPLNVTIADPKEAFELESDSTTHAVRRPSATTGLLYGANHFESETMPEGGASGRDYRWPTLTRHDATQDKLGPDEVRALVGDVGGFVEGPDGPSTNVLATVVEYGASVDDTVIVYGSDPDGKGVSARGPMTRLRLGEAFRAPR